MLINLHVKNLALIEETEVNFGPGLNILSGETGAGKSIIIGSINLALGEKVSKSMIREHSDHALVELVFSVDHETVREQLRLFDVEPDGDEIIMTRKISSNGRSVCRINSETVSVGLMRKVASLLIDIHGQHEHQSLLTKKNHLKYLDAFAGHALSEKKEALAECYRAYSAVKQELENASLDAEQQARELSFLQFEIQEIEEAHLQPGEDEQLEAQYRKLSNGRRILDAVSECQTLCADGAENAGDAIGRGLRALCDVSDYDETIGNLVGQLQEIEALITDFNHDLAAYLNSFEYSDELFQEIQERLDQINHLKSKYGRTIEQILAQKKNKEADADRLLHFDEYRRKLENDLVNQEKEVRRLSGEITAIRTEAAGRFADETQKALQDLNFLDVQFETEIKQMDHYSSSGWDEVRFLISTNPGEPLKPLDTVASGGELSRIMLGLKTILAENDEIETLIFDEIDSGISGRTAQMVAQKIKLTASNHQIICITHLPQIASMADSHFLIEKTSSDASTISSIRELSEQETVDELARMLGGVRITDTVLQSAREMRELAKQLSDHVENTSSVSE